jgi:hypothetical protein
MSCSRSRLVTRNYYNHSIIIVFELSLALPVFCIVQHNVVFLNFPCGYLGVNRNFHCQSASVSSRNLFPISPFACLVMNHDLKLQCVVVSNIECFSNSPFGYLHMNWNFYYQCAAVSKRNLFFKCPLSDHNWLTAIAPDPVHEFNEARSECV